MANQANSMGLPSGRAPGRGQGPDIVRGARDARLNPDKDRKPTGADIIARRHEDWQTNNVRWQWLLDSYEGGDRYRNAVYGVDRHNRPLRNLIRHKRESPDPLEFPNTNQGGGVYAAAAAPANLSSMVGPYPGQLGADPTATAQDDDYENRRARTTPPNLVDEVVSIHLGKIYDQQVSRRGPAELQEWWENCTGSGITIDEWARETVAPLLLVLGKLDLVFDRPAIPAWERVETRADEIRLGLEGICAGYILPDNMVWWENYPSGEYRECLVREYWSPALEDAATDPDAASDPAGNSIGDVPGQMRRQVVRWRHWTESTVTLYDAEGDIVEGPTAHGYPGVPILPLKDRLAHRTPMVGKSRYEFIAHCMRDYYNRDSELILSDTLQAAPLLSGPEEVCRGDSTISIGPGYLLPKIRKGVNGEGYEGWEFVSPSKEPAESIRKSLDQIRERVDRDACLMKPAGVTGTTGGTVSQSGYSKEMDAETGNKKLSDISRSLARAERQMAEFALACRLRRTLTPAERAAISITYPSRFQLKQGQQILNELVTLTQIVALQQQVSAGAKPATTDGGTPADQAGGNPPMLAASGSGGLASGTMFLMPTLLAELYSMYARATLPGRDDDVFRQVDREAMAFYHLHALPQLGAASDREAMAGHGTEEATAGDDPMGQSAATSVSPSVVNVR